ncbi:NAD(P)-dependent oxidoreductase [Phytomonospora endophytica]|uniref:3-hydroxyisobutyrate dehydrogenase-like beta-hydroxyacid dehydrogenase n=1 Tax=Phytomonospora endophytica TaxID=714109 RepID=A0A841FH30_9ACTN|nr:NAD(P)-binding domain-containing protein [Phytomonospora endophytica]MBB6036631.1 3-hydroxyisobutyrate dehydrogenase-like beta-hydroxyacid dehydrogenase [Phytomonospora endophytica]GIG65952.1 dehydrogenase [Phytomonospora endophytica]
MKTPITLLGLGSMGRALATAWLAAGHPVTVWNRTPGKEPAGAAVAATAAEAVAANRLVVVCLLDDASVESVLASTDLDGRDLVNLTTNTPGEGRVRAEWAVQRGARFLDGGIMVPPAMVATPAGFVLYSGSRESFDEHRAVLSAVARPEFTGDDPGRAALLDVALLSAMTGLFGGIVHAYAVTAGEVPPTEFAPMLAGFLTAMSGVTPQGVGERLASGDHTTGVASTLAMQTAASGTLLRTAGEQGVSTELIEPYLALMERRVAEGHGDEGSSGLVGGLGVTAGG